MLITKSLEVYRQKENFITPLASSSGGVYSNATTSIGDLVVIDGDEVWVKHHTDQPEHENCFFKASYYPDFIRINKALFEKVS